MADDQDSNMTEASTEQEPALIVTKEAGVCSIMFNRPAALNAVTPDMIFGMAEALRTAADDPDIRVIVLTGAGRAFCAGGDRSGKPSASSGDESLDDLFITTESFDERAARFGRYGDVADILHGIEKPVVAVLRGPVAGAGIALAAACDLRIASRTTFFKGAYVSAGLSGDIGAAYFTTRLAGPAVARRLFFLEERIDAEEALRLGLVDRLVDDDSLEEEAGAWINSLRRQPPLAVWRMKRNLLLAESGASLLDCIEQEAAAMAETLESDDAAEALQAFREKREPRFRGS